MPPKPPVLMRLKDLGLSQRAIAEHLGASTSAVSAWWTGKNPFDEPYRTEAEALLAVVSEHLAHGGTLDTIPFHPTVFMNPGGMTFTGEGLIPAEVVPDLLKLHQELASLPPQRQWLVLQAWHMRNNATQLAARLDMNPMTWHPSARELDDLRRLVQALRNDIVSLLAAKARAALEE